VSTGAGLAILTIAWRDPLLFSRAGALPDWAGRIAKASCNNFTEARVSLSG
jgi:hypothetical protein